MSIKTFRTLITVFFLCVFTVFAIYRVRLYLASDSKAPVITADTDAIEASVSVTDEELLAGMRAEDNMDGDVTGSLVVASKSKFIKKGTLNVNYAAFDKNNNVGVYTRELTYVDYESPKFQITQPLRVLTGDTRANILEHIAATDCLNGNITSQIMYTLGERTMTGDRASIQTMNLQVTNSAGDTATLELEIDYDDYNSYYTPAPQLSDYVIYTKVGEVPNYRGLLIGIWTGGVTRSFSGSDYDASDVQINSTHVNVKEPGTYPVYYRLIRTNVDGAREMLGIAKLLVVVEE